MTVPCGVCGYPIEETIKANSTSYPLLALSRRTGANYGAVLNYYHDPERRTGVLTDAVRVAVLELKRKMTATAT